MKVSLDGGLTWNDASNGVRVLYEDVDVPGEEQLGEVHVNLTDEGIITDVWATRVSPMDHNIGTESETLMELCHRLVEEGA